MTICLGAAERGGATCYASDLLRKSATRLAASSSGVPIDAVEHVPRRILDATKARWVGDAHSAFQKLLQLVTEEVRHLFGDKVAAIWRNDARE